MTIGSLVVNVVAKTSNLVRNLQKGRTAVRSFVGFVTGKLAGLAGVFAAAFSAGALGNTISEMDDIADSAERLGTKVESLSGLLHAAFMTDVSQSSLIKALTIMEKNVANGAKGLGVLRLDLEQLKQLEADEMFMRVADAINRLPTPAEQTAAAMAAFGRSGPDLLELIRSGRDGIAEMVEEAKALGLTFDETAAEHVANADKALKRLGAALKGLARNIAQALAPLVDLINASIEGAVAAERSEKLADQVVDQLTPEQRDRFRSIADRGGGATAFQEFSHEIRKIFPELSVPDQVAIFTDFLEAVRTHEERQNELLADSLERMDKEFQAKIEALRKKRPGPPAQGLLNSLTGPLGMMTPMLADMWIDQMRRAEPPPSELARIGTAIDSMINELRPVVSSMKPGVRRQGIIERDTAEGFAFARARSGDDPVKKIAKNSDMQVDQLKQLNAQLKERGHGFVGDINITTHNV